MDRWLLNRLDIFGEKKNYHFEFKIGRMAPFYLSLVSRCCAHFSSFKPIDRLLASIDFTSARLKFDWCDALRAKSLLDHANTSKLNIRLENVEIKCVFVSKRWFVTSKIDARKINEQKHPVFGLFDDFYSCSLRKSGTLSIGQISMLDNAGFVIRTDYISIIRLRCFSLDSTTWKTSRNVFILLTRLPYYNRLQYIQARCRPISGANWEWAFLANVSACLSRLNGINFSAFSIPDYCVIEMWKE